MTELEAYRQHILSSPKCCKALVRRAGTDAALEALWGDPVALAGVLRTANRLTASEIGALIAPMLDAAAPTRREEAEGPPINRDQKEHDG